MAGMNWDEMMAEGRLIAEQAVRNLRSLNRVCRLVPDGQVLDVAERFAMEKGRELVASDDRAFAAIGGAGDRKLKCLRAAL